MSGLSLSNVSMNRAEIARFRKLALVTVLFVYFLILVGGAVRASGAGMGCPDWPTCFGRWIPPVSESQLPSDYQEIYAERGYRETSFNVRKTWIEYLNRLLGVFTGLWIMATVFFSLPLRKRDSKLVTVSVVGLLLVVFQGWLGSRVVASNLAPGMITLHMLLAQVIVCLLIYAFLRANRTSMIKASSAALPRMAHVLLWLAVGITALQLLTGSQVREAVDIVSKANDNANRHLWIDNLPFIFAFHRFLAYPTVLLNLALGIYILQHKGLAPSARSVAIAVIALTVGTLAMGLSLDRLNVPAFAQPLHLWLASMILGALFYLVFVNHYAAVSVSSAKLSGEGPGNPDADSGQWQTVSEPR